MRRQLQGSWRWAARCIGIAFSIFQLYTAAIGLLPDMQQRALHVLFGMSLTFMLMQPAKRGKPETKVPIWDVVLIGFVVASCLNVYSSYFRFAKHPMDSTTIDIVLAVSIIILAIEAGRRVLGLVIP